MARVTSVLVFALLTYFATTTQHTLAELSLALITGGTLLVTPQLTEVLLVSTASNNSPQSSGDIYLRVVTLLTCTGVIVAVLGAHEGHVHLPGVSSTKLAILIAAIILEIVVLAGLVVIWLIKSGRDILPEQGSVALARWARRITSKPRRWLASTERRNLFGRLGGLLFFAGVIMQFIAGS